MINPKHKAIKDKQYRRVMNSLPCCNCLKVTNDNMDVVGAHVTDKNSTMGGKGSDYDSIVPLCFFCHAEEHKGVKTFWGNREPKILAKRLGYVWCEGEMTRSEKINSMTNIVIKWQRGQL